jgi:hypothetical protein
MRASRRRRDAQVRIPLKAERRPVLNNPNSDAGKRLRGGQNRLQQKRVPVTRSSITNNFNSSKGRKILSQMPMSNDFSQMIALANLFRKVILMDI